MKHVKSISCAGLLSFLTVLKPDALNAQSETPEILLLGIVRWPGHQLALVQYPDGPSAAPFQREVLLEPGDRDGKIELRELNGSSAKVILSSSGQEREVSFPSGNAPGNTQTPTPQQPCSIQLENAKLDVILRLYQTLSGRTLLRRSGLPNVQLTVPCTSAPRKVELLKALDRALSEKDLSIQPHREKFAFVAARPADFTAIKPELWTLVEDLTPASSRDEVLAPGMINFPATDASQVLRVFQELVGLTLIQPTTLPMPTMSFRTESEMTRTEAIYTFAATLALNQISIQPAGDEFLLIFPTVLTNNMAQLLSRIQVRAVATNTIVPPAGRLNGTTSLNQAVAIFQELLGKRVELASSTTTPVLLFQNQSEMKRDSLLYGLECLFGINGLFVIPNENGDGFKVVDRGQLDLKRPRPQSNSSAQQ